MTSRKLVSRWRPPGFSGGSKSLISFHCLFVRSVGYLFFRIQCPYRLDGQVVKLSCSKQVQRFSSQLLIRNFSNSFSGKESQAMTITTFVARFFSASLLVVGLSHALQPKQWRDFFLQLKRTGVAGIIIAM